MTSASGAGLCTIPSPGSLEEELATMRELAAVIKENRVFFVGTDTMGQISLWSDSGTPCEDRWEGITCNTEARRITKIDLLRVAVTNDLSLDAFHFKGLQYLEEARLPSTNLFAMSGTLFVALL